MMLTAPIMNSSSVIPTDSLAGNVLIVDDNPSLRSLFSRWLEEAGFRCFVASNLQEAQSQLGRFSIDVMTLDIDMPGPSSLDWLPVVRAQKPDIRTIIVSAWDDIGAAIKACSRGASMYLLKPLAQADLVAEVRRRMQELEADRRQRAYVLRLERQIQEQQQFVNDTAHDILERLICAALINDDEDAAHVRQVGITSAIVAKEMHLGSEFSEQIRCAAPLHDIGKIAIPREILRKSGPLTPEEFEIVKSHTTVGASILAQARSPLLRMAELIALNHHERWDGKGYPHGRDRQQIPIAARIVAIADGFDAMTHDRTYRPAKSREEAIDIIKQEAGFRYDPDVVNAFFNALPLIFHWQETRDVDCILGSGTLFRLVPDSLAS